MNWVYLVYNGYRWQFALKHNDWFLVSYGKVKVPRYYRLLPRLLWFGKLDHETSKSNECWYLEGQTRPNNWKKKWK